MADDGPEPEASTGADRAAAPTLLTVNDIPYGAPLVVPRVGVSALQGALAAANERARADALERLAAWFPGVDFAALAQNVDDRRFCVVSLGEALISHLRGPETVDRLLRNHDHLWGQGGISLSHADVPGHQPPGANVLRAGMPTTDERGWVESGGLVDALDAGWTAILHGTDRFDPFVASVCADLSAAYAARLNCNIYISHGAAKGFGPHWDTHDTIIVPVHGVKHWTIYEPEVLSAQKPWIGRTISHRPVWEGRIEPGTALVIPRGWGHEVDEAGDLSIHYTLGIVRLEAHHVLERADHEAGFWPALRADFPFDLRQPASSYAGSVFDDPNGLAREVATLLTPELVERAFVTFRARIPSRETTPLLRAFDALMSHRWDGAGIRVVAPGGIMLADERPGQITLAFADRLIAVADEAVDAFLALATGQPLALAALPPVVIDGTDERERFAQQLVRAGIATIERAEPAEPADGELSSPPLNG